MKRKYRYDLLNINIWLERQESKRTPRYSSLESGRDENSRRKDQYWHQTLLGIFIIQHFYAGKREMNDLGSLFQYCKQAGKFHKSYLKFFATMKIIKEIRGKKPSNPIHSPEQTILITILTVIICKSDVISPMWFSHFNLNLEIIKIMFAIRIWVWQQLVISQKHLRLYIWMSRRFAIHETL